MKTARHPFRFAALAALALILPFAVMQVINAGVRRDDAATGNPSESVGTGAPGVKGGASRLRPAWR